MEKGGMDGEVDDVGGGVLGMVGGVRVEDVDEEVAMLDADHWVCTLWG